MALPRRSAGSSSQSTGYLDVSELAKYKLINNIGKGSFGVISKVQRIEDGKEFALKQLDYSKMTDKDRKQILAEVAILESLKHRNIVQLIQKIKDPQNERIYIVMEYCTSGDLSTLIRKAQRTNQPLHEDKIWNIFLQITLALHHCHWPAERPSSGQRGSGAGASGRQSAQGFQQPGGDAGTPRYQVLHRDLKPENVFLSDDFVKLGDFGLSKDMGTNAFTSTYVGTPLYMPPEILAENRYDTKSDIWSLGCLIFELCALSSPFSTAQTQAELISMVRSGKLPSLPNHISPALKSVIKAMLNLNPTRRPSTQDLLNMDEMKLHRKLFTVQNQTALLMSKRDELNSYETRLASRAAALDERERDLAARENSIQARESSCIEREEKANETQKKMDQVAENLRVQWDKLREERERERDVIGLPGLPEERAPPRRASAAPVRPNLEERTTLPLAAVARFPRNPHPVYEDTPSKIPAAFNASPAPFTTRLAALASPIRQSTPLRRNATKSLGNLAATARAQAERDAAWAAAGLGPSAMGETTPAKQMYPFPSQFPIRQRTSIGSPSEVNGVYNEDVSMASPAPSFLASPAPFVPRPRRSSIAPTAIAPSGATSSVLSGSSSGSAESSTSSSSNGSSDPSTMPTTAPSSGSAATTVPPTMIPAPVQTFVYREIATPAKWSPEDPDLPSPFLRKQPPTSGYPTMPSSTYNATIADSRQPLGSINLPQNPPTSSSGNPTSNVLKQQKMPRSKSGGLHQHVLRHNALQAGVNEPVPTGGIRKVSVTGSGGSGIKNGGLDNQARARAAAVGREAAKLMGV